MRHLLSLFKSATALLVALWVATTAQSVYLINAILNAIFNSTAFNVTGDVWVSLHTADPGQTGASEATGGAGPYGRVQAPFPVASGGSGSITNSGNIDFPGMPACTVSHAGCWDAQTNGNFLRGSVLTGGSKVVNAGDTFRIPAGSLSGSET